MLAAIALGSNLPSAFGEPADNLGEALHRMQALGNITEVSSFYSTEPVGYLDQPQFVNAAALLETELGPLDLLRALLGIEREMGRDREGAPPKGPRIIDLDVLLYQGEGGPLVLRDPELVIPHPAMQERQFVLHPLSEIASSLRHPILDCTVAELRARLDEEARTGSAALR